MPIPSTLPASFGKVNWANYDDYWREEDAEWLQDRTILRYNDAAARAVSGQIPTPVPGMVTYNRTSLSATPVMDRLEMYSEQHAAWVPLLMLANITSTQDTTAGVGLAHKLATGKGVIFQPAQTVFDNPVNVTAAFTTAGAFSVAGGALTAATTGISIKSAGANATATLTTNATTLFSTTPISAPGMTVSSGAFNASAVAGSLQSLAVTNVLTAGVSSNISGTTFNNGWTDNGTGYITQNGFYRADANGPVILYRNAADGGSWGNSYIQVTKDDIVSAGRYHWMYPLLLIRNGNAILYYDTNGNYGGNIAPSIYGGTPNAALYPDGTIWIS